MKKDHTTVGVVVGVLVLLAVAGMFLFTSKSTVIVAPSRISASATLVAAEETSVDSPAEYTTTDPSPDGIGKVYLGREISKVMGHPAIGWLERDSREAEEQVTKAIEALDLDIDTVIADIGAGSGYYSYRIAPLLNEGKVIAVDIQPEMLEFLTKQSAELGITNVDPALGKVDDIGLAPESIDAALMVDAYHEFSHPAEMLRSIRLALRPGGKVFLLEYRAEDPKVPIKPLHKMTEAQAIKEFEAAGLSFVENIDVLPWQHLLIFEKR